jgi:hypothetical protein
VHAPLLALGRRRQREEHFARLSRHFGALDLGKIGGATLVNADTSGGSSVVDEFAICFRFKLKILGSMEQRSRGTILNIGDWNSNEAQLWKICL